MRAEVDFAELLTLIRAARGLEAGGYNNFAKLLWALAYSAEVSASNTAGVPRGAELADLLDAIVESLKTGGADEAIITAFEKGRQGVREDRTIPYTDIPQVHASRTTGELFLGRPPALTAGGDHPLALREFRAIWYLDALSPAEVLAGLEANSPIIRAQVAGLSEAQCRIAPAAGEWNMHELVSHILFAQELLSERVELLLTYDNPNLASRAVWTQKAGDMLLTADVLGRYLALRGALLERLAGVSGDDWWRTGWHDEFGPQTLLSQATYFTRHEMSHLPQFFEIRRAAGATLAL